jgi:hypothetical protein
MNQASMKAVVECNRAMARRRPPARLARLAMLLFGLIIAAVARRELPVET